MMTIQDFLGAAVKDPPLLRIPVCSLSIDFSLDEQLQAKLFRDYTPGQSLSHILATCFKYKSEQDMFEANTVKSLLRLIVLYRRRWDFASPGKLDRNVELFMAIEKKLTEVVFPVLWPSRRL